MGELGMSPTGFSGPALVSNIDKLMLKHQVPDAHMQILSSVLGSLFQVTQKGLRQVPDPPGRKDKLHVLDGYPL